MKCLIALTTPFLLVTLCGCGTSLPTEGVGKQAVQERVSEWNQNRLRLIGFHKTDGQTSVENGVQHYQMAYECDVELMEDCYWINTHDFFTDVINTDFSNAQTDYYGSDRKHRDDEYWNSAIRQHGSKLSFLLPPYDFKDFMKGGARHLDPKYIVKKGQQGKVTGKIMFEKSEKGWRVEHVDIDRKD